MLDRFKKLISSLAAADVGFLHMLNVYRPNEQKYGTDFFTNLEEIMKYFSDTINILDFGETSKKDYNGCKRTYFYGKVITPSTKNNKI